MSVSERQPAILLHCMAAGLVSSPSSYFAAWRYEASILIITT